MLKNNIWKYFLISLLVFGLGLSFSFNSAVFASENYPEKEIRLIVPWAAGGGTDLIGRQIAYVIERELGRPVVVENRTGGGGLVGFRTIAHAAADGYTVGANSISQLLQKAAGIDHQDWTEMTPIAIYNEDPASLTVKADAPWDTLEEFVEYARENPGAIRVSNSGPGAIWHISALRMEREFGVEFIHVPYEGGSPAAIAVAGGHVEATTTSPAEVAALVKAGELKILAIPAENRSNLFPDVPTFIEEGYDFTAGTWRGLVGPAGMPDYAVKALEEAVAIAVEDEGFINFMNNGGFGIRYMGAEAFGNLLAIQDQELKELFEEISF